jgi:chaperonin GroES
MAKIKPLQDKILLKKVESKTSKEEVVKGGIILPIEEKPIKYGEVVDISEELSNVKLKIGDKVLYSEYGGKDIKIDEDDFLLISYKDISAIIEL